MDAVSLRLLKDNSLDIGNRAELEIFLNACRRPNFRKTNFFLRATRES